VNGVGHTSTVASHRYLSVKRRHLGPGLASPTPIFCVSPRSRKAEGIGTVDRRIWLVSFIHYDLE
jgi:hypothetical protein